MAKKLNPFEEGGFPPFTGMPPDAIRFLTQLKKNNTREWFERNKDRYEQSLRQPFLSLLHDLGERLHKHEPAIVVDPKRAIYRIYRDVRFSKDKSPFKLWIAGSFTFASGNKNSSPGFYLHIASDEAIVAGGLYMPEPDQLKRIRADVAEHPERLRSILEARAFKKMFGALQGEVMKRPPRGFDADHPAIDLLLHKQFFVWKSMPAEDSLKPAYVKVVSDACILMLPLIRYLFALTR